LSVTRGPADARRYAAYEGAGYEQATTGGKFSMKVFISYHRSLSTWPAITIQRYLVGRGIDVFLDKESISSGRFENVILNEIRERDHFIVLISEGTPSRLSRPDDWVAREIVHALEAQKNIIPVLLDGVDIADIPYEFTQRDRLLAQNALSMPAEYVNEALDRLYNMFLCNPTIQVRNAYLAEEHWERALEAGKQKNWHLAETEVDRALRLSQRPDYYFLLANIVHAQGRADEAIKIIDQAIALDPFGYELMEKKFYLLQEVDQMKEAIHLFSNRGWKMDARVAAHGFGESILDRVREGRSLKDSVDSIRSLSAMHLDLPDGKRQLAILQDVISFAPDHIANALRTILKSDELFRYRDKKDDTKD
jgi:tetratricopeptide (TPR) repeat protein